MECVQETHTHVTEYLGGRCTSDGVKGGIGIPGLDSWLVGFSTDTKVIGLDTVPPDDRPPANTMLHWAFDAMVGICTRADPARAVARLRVVAQARHPDRRPGSCAPTAISGVAAIVALECGWIVTEVGRQPWIVYEVMRTEDAVTEAERRVDQPRPSCSSLYAALGAATRRPARDVPALAERPTTTRFRTGRAPPDDRRGAAVSSADAVAAVLWVGVTLYAVFGGADFGGGLLGAGRRHAASAASGRAR